jgi:3-oxoacyl-[acyl-carrier-protein] synthase III
MISGKLLGREATFEEAPIVLDRYANTASAGSLIAFNLYHQDLEPGDLRRDLFLRRGLFHRQPGGTKTVNILRHA